MGRHAELQPIDIELLLRAFELKKGQKLFVQVYSKTEGGMRVRNVLKTKLKFATLYPDECASIRVYHTKIKGKFYMVLEQIGDEAVTAYKEQDGKYKPIHMTADAEIKRRVRLMAEDGYSKEQILEIEGPEAEKYFDSF